MYDTIHISFPLTKERLRACEGYFEEKIISRDDNGCLKSIKAYIKNLFVYLGNSKITVRGSLPHFYFGTNLRMLTFEEAIDAMVKICNIFQVNPNEVIISEVHLAINLLIKRSCSYCYNYLGDLGRKHKRDFASGIVYATERNCLLVYDKGKEMKNKRKLNKEFIREIVDKNILRIEVQKKKLGKTRSYTGEKLTLNDLMDKTNFDVLFYETIEIFLSIEKKMIYFSPEQGEVLFKNKKSLQDTLCGLYLSNPENKEICLNTLKSNYNSNLINRKMYQRIKDYIKKISNRISGMRVINPIADIEEKLKTIKPLINKTDTSGHPLNYYYL